MLTKNDIRDAILRECDVCIHLHGKVPAGGLDYRPTADQRNTLELLRYLSFCAMGGAYIVLDGNFDRYREAAAASEGMSAEDFPAVMEKQKQEITSIFENLSDAELTEQTTKLPTGEEVTLGRGLYELPLRWMTGYRMQLFLYAKAAGNTEIWTPNCWVGVDWERPSPS